MDWLVIGALTIVINVILYAVLSSRLHGQYNSKTFLQAAQKEMELLMTEMNQSAERNVAVFEDRVQKLRLLMEELDHKLVMVRKEHDLQERSRNSYSQVRERIMETRRGTVQSGLDETDGRILPSGMDDPGHPGTDRSGSKADSDSLSSRDAMQGRGNSEAIYSRPEGTEMSRQDTGGARAGNQPRSEAAPGIHPAARAVAKVQAREELKKKVLGLYRSGMDASLIASQTGMSRGEVDLIISLGEGSGE